MFQDNFAQAELALAAYANLTIGKPAKAALVAAGMADFQAQVFADKWTVIDQYTPTELVPVYDNFGVIVDYVEQYNGLSVTVFEEIATGKRHVAIRGTEITDIGDLTADGGILLHGIPDLSDQYQSLKSKIEAWQANGVLPGTFTLAGHSLGGWLAEGLSVDFAASIEHTYVYNSPGLFSVGFGNLLQQINDALGTSFLAAPNLASLTNIRAGAGNSIIAGLGQPLSPPIVIVTEDQTQSDVPEPAGARNHSQSVLTDSLAVHALFAEMSSTLTVEDINSILNASGNRNAMTLEDAVNALGELFNAGTEVSGVDDRDAMYQRMQAIRDSAGYQLAVQAKDFITVQPLASLGGSGIVAKARQDNEEGLAYRYALVNLNPFVITGDTAIYDGHNLDGELDLYDPIADTGALTEQYLKDRSKMLGWKMQFDSGAHDIDDPIVLRVDKSYGEDWDSWGIKGDWDFIDHATLVDGSPLKLSIDGVDLTTTANHQIAFGSEDADSLNGDELNDNLYGMSGADTLTGNGGNDYLEGGAGFDTYVVNAGDGFDTVLDTDGSGVIKFGTLAATGSAGLDPRKWVKLSSDSYADTQNAISYTKSIVDGETRLLIKKGDATVLVKGWSEGELGIVLGEGAALELPATGGPIVGDRKPLDTNADEDGIQVDYDALRNLLTEDTIEARQDILYGSAGNDHIKGLSGIDYLAGKDGDDLLEGGTGDDVLAGGQGADHLKGEDGNDILLGEHDLATVNSYNYTRDGSLIADRWETQGAGVTQYSWQISIGFSEAAGGDDVIDAGAGNDFVDAGGGDDRVDGGEGDDVVFGGEGSDIFLGGAGDDVLTGNAGNSHPQNDGADYIDGGTGDDRLWGGGGNDVLLGDAGNDTLTGDGNATLAQDEGDDVLLGGDGDDKLYGNGGSDLLMGGDGADELFGGDGDDILDGGAGADYLAGGGGDDIYLNVGGEDTVFDFEGDNTIILATADHLGVAGLNTTLETNSGGVQYTQLQVSLDSGETLKLAGVFGANRTTLQFASGGELDLETLVAEKLTTPLILSRIGAPGGRLYGGAGDDTLTGSAGSDTLLGYGGNDALAGRGGDDVLLGGAGDDRMLGDAGESIVAGELHGRDTLDGGAGDDYLVGGGGNDTLIGGEGDDDLRGDDSYDLQIGPAYHGDDVLDGGAGDDTLIGGTGNDTLVGGKGDDVLDGGPGMDVYRLDRGDGRDRIMDTANSVVAFRSDVDLRDFHVCRTAYGYRVAYGEAGDSVEVPLDWAESGGIFRFADGSYVRSDELLNAPAMIEARGDAENNLLVDTRPGVRFSGGGGDDVLLGGAGDNVYVFNRGDGADAIVDLGGADTVRFGPGITRAEVRFEYDDAGEGLPPFRVRLTDSEDSIAIRNGEQGVVEWFGFDDGTLLSFAEMAALQGWSPPVSAPVDGLYRYQENGLVLGTPGDDTLEDGDVGEVVYVPGTGDDTLDVYAGENYFYLFEQGDGHDTLNNEAHSKNETLVFGAGIAPESVSLTVSTRIVSNYSPWTQQTYTYTSRDLTIRYGSLGDTIYIPDGLGASRVERMLFADGHAVRLSPSVSLADGVYVLADLVGNNVVVISEGTGPTELDIPSMPQARPSVYWDGTSGNDVYVARDRVGINGEAPLPQSDVAAGGEGDDMISTLSGNDYLDGGPGNDLLQGGSGSDIYVFREGGGHDVIRDAVSGNERNYIHIISERTLAPIFAVDSRDLVIRYSDGDRDEIRVESFYPDGTDETAAISGVLLTRTSAYGYSNDRVYYSLADIKALANTAPVAANPIAPQLTLEDSRFEFSVPQDAFLDKETGAWDRLTFSATLENGAALPAWLSFDAVSGRFFGTPGNDDVGGTQIRLTAADAFGLSAASTFSLDVVNVNDAPLLTGDADDQTVTQGEAFTYRLPANLFTDADKGDVLSYRATLADGTALPRWLSFDPQTLVFSGTPTAAGVVKVRVTATDSGGLAVSDSFDISVRTLALSLYGTSKADVLVAGDGDDTLFGLGGEDKLYGNAGNDRLDGGPGADRLWGGSGDDTYVVDNVKDIVTENLNEGTDTVESSVSFTLGNNVENLVLTGSSAISGTGNSLNNVMRGNSAANSLSGAAGNDTLDGMGGNDTLTGGTGNDTYVFGRGYGSDTLVENDATTGNTDIAQFSSGVSAEQIWFRKAGNNLEASIIGTGDKLVIKDWYLGTKYHVEQFKTTDGNKTLLDSQVQNLVNAMASFAPPAAGQTTLPQNYQDALAGVIAANWQ